MTAIIHNALDELQPIEQCWYAWREDDDGTLHNDCVNKACTYWSKELGRCRFCRDRDQSCECMNDISEKPDGKRPPGEPRWAHEGSKNEPANPQRTI